MKHTAKTLPPRHYQAIQACYFVPEEYDELHVIEQGAGYRPVYVGHCKKDGVTFIAQEGADFLVVFTAEAETIGHFAKILHETPVRRFYSRGLPSANGRAWDMTWQGTREGNPGDWTLALEGTEYRKRIQGNWGLDELAKALHAR